MSWAAGPGVLAETTVRAVANKLKIDYELLIELVAYARFGVYPTKDFFSRLASITTLLPVQELGPLSAMDILKVVPEVEEKAQWSGERLAALERIKVPARDRFSDENMLAIWPVRSKVDLSIRRTRFADTYQAYVIFNNQARLWECVAKLPGFDLITVVNILNAELLLSTMDWSWFDFYSKLGAFDGTVDHYIAVAKVVNDLVKKREVQGFDFWRVVECATISGYRNPPFPGFDMVEEARKLAEGGGEHGLSESTSLTEFKTIAEMVLTMSGEAVGWSDFVKYVMDGEWETTGSSSVGVVEWEYDAESGHFKARKNLVPDVVNLLTLALEAYVNKTQRNVAILKSELAKLRLAVASDMETYLQMAWLVRLLGGGYLSWPGTTIEEDVVKQTDRMIKMLDTIGMSWNLPFDYAAFDHQPNTSELKVIVEILIKNARLNVPVDKLDEFEAICARILSGFDNATLTVRDEQGGKHTYKVLGGVMSGLRLTTILGNGWNTVMTGWVKSLLVKMGVDVSFISGWVRGDDSAIVAPCYAQVMLFRLLYEAIGAKGSDGKFGIHWGKSEFLRVWYSDKRCRGWPARALPGLQQRKPWTSSPWDEESVMINVYEATTILRRRGCDSKRLDCYWKAVKLNWSRRKHLSTDWLQVPKALGGLGVEPWSGTILPLNKWPRVDINKIKVTNRTTWRRDKVIERYLPFMPVTEAEAEVIAQDEIAAKVTTDDVPSLNSVLRAQATIPESAVFVKINVDWRIPNIQELLLVSKMLSSFQAKIGEYTRALNSFSSSSFGYYARLAVIWSDVAKIYKIRKQRRVLMWFEGYCPDFVYEVRSLERRGLARWEAIDWLLGSTPLNRLVKLHPALTDILRRGVVQVMTTFLKKKLEPRSFSAAVAQVTSVLETALLQSELSRSIYEW